MQLKAGEERTHIDARFSSKKYLNNRILTHTVILTSPLTLTHLIPFNFIVS